MGPSNSNPAQPLAPWMQKATSQGVGGPDATPHPLADQGVIQVPPTFDLGKYGDLQTYPCIFPGAQTDLAINRPSKAVRTFLLIVNTLVIPNIITVQFDNPATPTNGIQIPAGGNLFMDYFVPQGDVYVYSPIAGVVQCWYCHVNVADARRVYQALSG